MFGCIQSYIGVDGLGGMGHGGAVVKTLELFTPDGTIMTHKGSSINYVITFGTPKLDPERFFVSNWASANYAPADWAPWRQIGPRGGLPRPSKVIT